MPLLSDLLNGSMANVAATEVRCRTSCPVCGKMQTLKQATVDQRDPLETIYSCVDGCSPILIVSTPGVVSWEGRGYRIGGWMIRNPTDLFIQPQINGQEGMLPARPAALE